MIWQKKKKITLQDISLSHQQGSKVAHEEVLVKGKLMVVSIDTVYEEFEVELEEESTPPPKGEPQEGIQSKKNVRSFMTQRIHALKSQIIKNQQLRLLHIATHITMRDQGHQGKAKIIRTYYGPTWNQKGLSMEAHGGLKVLTGDTKVVQ